MRGLGIGIILTTLILTIGGMKEKLSDKEIMKRAEALGMVMETEEDKGLDDVLSATLTPEPTATVTVEPSDLPTTEPTVEPTIAPTTEPTVEPTAEPTVKPTAVPAKEPTKAPTKETGATDQSNSLISFTIERGMSSNEVADVLAKKGLIKDAVDFNQYIIKVGRASIIRVGNFSLKQGATYEEIVMKITTK